MSRCKETRLFLLLSILLVLVIGMRTVFTLGLYRRSPEWITKPNSSVVQAAALQQSTNTKNDANHIPSTENDTAKRSLHPNNGGAITNHPEVRAEKNVDTAGVLSSTNPDALEDFGMKSTLEAQTAQSAPDEVATNQACIGPDGGSLLNLNTATLEELDALPGIGKTIAGAILQERSKRGSFSAVHDLLDVKGIGEARFARLEPLVCVPDPSKLP